VCRCWTTQRSGSPGHWVLISARLPRPVRNFQLKVPGTINPKANRINLEGVSGELLRGPILPLIALREWTESCFRNVGGSRETIWSGSTLRLGNTKRFLGSPAEVDWIPQPARLADKSGGHRRLGTGLDSGVANESSGDLRLVETRTYPAFVLPVNHASDGC